MEAKGRFGVEQIERHEGTHLLKNVLGSTTKFVGALPRAYKSWPMGGQDGGNSRLR
jgi:hypothetical protein